MALQLDNLPLPPLYTFHYIEIPHHWGTELLKKTAACMTQDTSGSSPSSVTDLSYMARHLLPLQTLVFHIGKTRGPIIFHVTLTFYDTN